MMDWKLTLYILGATVFFIAGFMELYKKGIRQDKAKEAEIYSVALFCSVSLSTIAYFSFNLPGSYFAIAFYSAGAYVLQYYIDMKIIKALVRMYAKSKGVTLEGFKHDE